MEAAETFTGDASAASSEPAAGSSSAAESAWQPATGHPATGHPATAGPDGADATRNRRHRSRNRGGQRPATGDAATYHAPVAEAIESEEAGDSGEGPREAQHASCTMAQMRRFIKSRPYVPIHELRRRFEIEGGEDDVHPVVTAGGTIYVGLPPDEARFLADLIKAGEVGCELLLDPCSPAVVGVYAMRPVARQ